MLKLKNLRKTFKTSAYKIGYIYIYKQINLLYLTKTLCTIFINLFYFTKITNKLCYCLKRSLYVQASSWNIQNMKTIWVWMVMQKVQVRCSNNYTNIRTVLHPTYIWMVLYPFEQRKPILDWSWKSFEQVYICLNINLKSRWFSIGFEQLYNCLNENDNRAKVNTTVCTLNKIILFLT